MEYEDMKTVQLRENEWRTLVFYASEWIKHVNEIGRREYREDDYFIDAMNDTVRIEAICSKINEQI